jgi:hypothetical protein
MQVEIMKLLFLVSRPEAKEKTKEGEVGVFVVESTLREGIRITVNKVNIHALLLGVIGWLGLLLDFPNVALYNCLHLSWHLPNCFSQLSNEQYHPCPSSY